ncbi:hypothetical protein GCWU000342_00005 [Shuttleworthella satelles DSM 14600]|uniref:Uncharacterized protein n=1 Tax=Shuttleworthella satelles DSM 14600 TaxID=626523 RepID=C4GA86_9FIRM|nr:hypothetical protein GCWU000342_00005 [Shuttleworthia satelles DSM 14600]
MPFCDSDVNIRLSRRIVKDFFQVFRFFPLSPLYLQDLVPALAAPLY